MAFPITKVDCCKGKRKVLLFLFESPTIFLRSEDPVYILGDLARIVESEHSKTLATVVAELAWILEFNHSPFSITQNLRRGVSHYPRGVLEVWIAVNDVVP